MVRPDDAATDLPVAGEGARLYPDAFPHPVQPNRPSAGWLARTLVGERAAVLAPDPLYLRRPDATEPRPPSLDTLAPLAARPPTAP